eukprot:CAMPEP_0170175654 /NCGR_PEP_ID=MMETSP0040_2-20121228/8696_1 /TAXON_ID=641309 /ORGANISM="Lotharella oceanica, Strain CCMP622" /LENGTH=30 /DNA_ID= /DNA_START= /DNA_END= /DNA_ORIENTATION=
MVRTAQRHPQDSIGGTIAPTWDPGSPQVAN